MSNSVLPNKRILAVTALLALCAPALTPATRPDDYVARAMQLLRSLFPALGGTDSVIFDHRSLDRQLYPNVINPFTIKLSGSPDSPLWARFTFDFETHDLRDVSISGPFVHDRMDKLKEEVDEHPEWSDEEVVARLKAAGAKFGPDDQEAFLRALPLKKLEPITGRLEVVLAGLNIRSDPFDHRKPEALLSWVVHAKCHSADGRYEADSILLFEPFEGALWSFSISSPRRPTSANQPLRP